MSNMTGPDARVVRVLLMTVVGLLGVIAIELSDHQPSLLPSAVAQIPDTGKQRQDIITETRKTNELLGQILDHLRNKQIKVVNDDNGKTRDAAARSPARP